ncbi:MAG: Flp pilus assembly protein CpaB [Sulfitobacter sp.]|nr:Flp pilus assembly protein CpaB [Sulfitobacter sp.]
MKFEILNIGNKMRIKPIITTIFGIGIAAGSVFLTKEHLLDQPESIGDTPGSSLVEIYLARSSINYGELIEAHHVSIHLWPRDAVPPGAFTDIAQLVPTDPEQQRRAKGRFYPGEVMIATKVSHFGEKVTLVQKLGENTRAMAIKVDAVTAVGGFVTPGDYVDIVMTEGNNQDMRAVTILQKIRVIGVDQQSEEAKKQPEVARTITVEVSPEQGLRLALAQKAGSLSLTLRTLDGVEDKPMEMVHLRDLMNEEAPIAQVLVHPTVKINRGTDTEIVTIRRQLVKTDPVIAPEAITETETATEPQRATEPRVLPKRIPADVTNLTIDLETMPLDPLVVRPRMRPITVTQLIEQ